MVPSVKTLDCDVRFFRLDQVETQITKQWIMLNANFDFDICKMFKVFLTFVLGKM